MATFHFCNCEIYAIFWIDTRSKIENIHPMNAKCKTLPLFGKLRFKCPHQIYSNNHFWILNKFPSVANVSICAQLLRYALVCRESYHQIDRCWIWFQFVGFHMNRDIITSNSFRYECICILIYLQSYGASTSNRKVE